MAALRIDSLASLGVNFDEFDWLSRLDATVQLNAGDRSDTLEVPEKDAQTIVDAVVRLVLDLPRRSTPDVVWTLGDNELLVHSDKTSIICTSGVVTIASEVESDQSDVVTIAVPIGVGTRQKPGGLVMSTFTDIAGPPEIVSVWTDALQAFAWETLLEVARVIAAEVGTDQRGRSLVPGSIGAAPDTLIVQPVARHTLTVEG